jgi:hypothetical protein
MPKDLAFPVPAEGYVVSFVVVYEWGVGTTLHWFLRSLLQFYGLELHNLTPLGVLHIAAFRTPCEAYLGVDHVFDLWNYFFHVRCLQDPNIELIVSWGIVIHVKSGHGVDPTLTSPCLGQ